MNVKYFYILLLTIISFSSFSACKTVNIHYHPLTQKVIASGIRLDDNQNSLEGFEAYAAAPEAKAFAASVSDSGQIHAWGKA